MTTAAFVEHLHFDAQMIAVNEEVFTENFAVNGIYFGEGDPEHGGQHWNFTRSPGDGASGVCTVKEIQAVTVYGGIRCFRMQRTGIACEFDTETAKNTHVRRLTIGYHIDDACWSRLANQARKVFADMPYFELRSE